MNYRIEINDPKQVANVEAALKIIDPAAEVKSDNYDLQLIIEYSKDFFVRIYAPELPAEENLWEFQDLDILDPRYDQTDRVQRLKELIRLGVISLLGKYLQKKPPWGILSGVRPTKIFHYLRDKGFSIQEIREKLLTIFALDLDSAELLQEVGAKQEKFFRTPEYVGVYVGIPFCPSRCQYCSFPAVSLETHRHLVKDFLKALDFEIQATAELIGTYGFKVESIYLGGGTPTCLEEEAFSKILTGVKNAFVTETTVEYTVEAGRPETINEAKLKAMSDSGVTRVSVNPQTMYDSTLIRIGRKHTVAQVVEAVQMVKAYPDLLLNMDLILGLPGENGLTFIKSVKDVITLKPEAITIHTLAPKRAASWRKDFKSLDLSETDDISKAFAETVVILRENGFFPYYLYRQRSILADLANIGYAKEGKSSIYNIQMMEERQTIFGLGGGAVSKWVFGPDYLVVREQNPKCPATYSRLIKEQIVKKAQQTRLLLG